MARIIVVDDDTDILNVAKQWLGHEQHTVDTFSTGVKGYQNLSSNNYDIAILDWDLPDINGIDILKRFRAEGGSIPVIMLTGRSDIDFKVEGLESGADDYMTKPFHMKELLARIRVLLKKAESNPVKSPLPASNPELLARAELTGTGLASKFEFLEIIGEGAFGVVLKARHPQLDKFIAIKMIQKSELRSEVITRFEQEAKLVSKLDHKNIARIFDFGTTEKKQPYMVMEFITGKTLDQIKREKGALAIETALPMFIQIAEGMSHAHKMGILHRDLKPSNLILQDTNDSELLIKILDFGCAKFQQPTAAPGLTQEGQVIGSPYYMSPEQIQGKQTDERADIYSFGCTMYELLTGTVPHTGDECLAVLVKHVSDIPPPLAKARPDLKFPEKMEAIVARSMAKDPDGRYASMAELKQELESVDAKASSFSHSDPSKSWWQKLSQKILKPEENSAQPESADAPSASKFQLKVQLANFICRLSPTPIG